MTIFSFSFVSCITLLAFCHPDCRLVLSISASFLADPPPPSLFLPLFLIPCRFLSLSLSPLFKAPLLLLLPLRLSSAAFVHRNLTHLPSLSDSESVGSSFSRRCCCYTALLLQTKPTPATIFLSLSLVSQQQDMRFFAVSRRQSLDCELVTRSCDQATSLVSAS